MSFLKKVLRRTGIMILAVILYWVAFGIWASIPPWRPTNVSRSAVFLFGAPPNTAPFPIPTSKKGTWVNCWLDTERDSDRCGAIDADGAPIYEGPYIRYEGGGPVPQNELVIDKRAHDNMDYFRDVMVPIIHLRNGTILIPAEDADAARLQVSNWLQFNQQKQPWWYGLRWNPPSQ